jgi:predicted RNA-binding protein with PUA-like domain
MAYWLLKSEPDCYSIDDLRRDKTNMWEGCRNYTVRNFMRDLMVPGDDGFFYHSSVNPAGIVGTLKIARAGYPDPTQFDSKSEYFDPKSDPANPRWYTVDVEFGQKFKDMVTLAMLKETPGLEHMGVVQKGQRLSVMKVTPDEWAIVLRLAGVG